MKLVKLSLAAAVAAGALAMSASAVPLEEAIKDVDLNGYARMRYTHDRNKDAGDSSKGVWEFKSEVDFKAKIDDNFFGVVGIRFMDRDGGESHSSSNSQYHGNQNKYEINGKRVEQDSDFDIAKAYLGYTIGGTVIAVGRQGIGSFFTDDMYGDGVKITSTDIEGLTLTGFWMDSLENDSDIGSLDWGSTGEMKKLTTDHNLYGVGVAGSYDPVAFQLWYNSLEDVADLFAAELAFNFDISDDFSLGIKGQYAFSDLDRATYTYISPRTGLPVNTETSDADFWAAEASMGLFGIDLAAGYLRFEPDNKDRTSFVSFEDQGSFISPGEQLLDYTNFTGKNHYWYAVAGYTIPDTGIRIGADYLDGKSDGQDAYEVVGRISYKYNQKLSFKTWYSHYKIDGAAGAADQKNDRIRFEAKYSF